MCQTDAALFSELPRQKTEPDTSMSENPRNLSGVARKCKEHKSLELLDCINVACTHPGQGLVCLEDPVERKKTSIHHLHASRGLHPFHGVRCVAFN